MTAASGTTGEPLLLKVEQAALLLNYGRSTVYELIASGQLPAIKLGRTTRIPRTAVEEFVRRMAAQSDR